jgi:triacylglycerol lipase
VVVFVHGGGFSRGAKHTAGAPFYDNIGLWAAAHELVGITVNYRLAPQFGYPAGVEDLSRVVAWVKAHAKQYGGDPARVYLWGHSAGGAHVADYIVRTPKPGIAGAVLTSGIYTLGKSVSVWKDYYGDDVSRYAERESLPLLARAKLPLLVTCAELDPESFVADCEALTKARAASGTPTQSLRLPAHSHISETYAVGTGDESLSAPVLQFIRATPH